MSGNESATNGSGQKPKLVTCHEWREAPSAPSGQLAADVNHAARGLQEVRFADVVSRFFEGHRALDECGQLIVAASALHHAVKVVIELRKQAGTDFSIGSKANAAALSAESLRDGRDDADLPNAVIEGIAHGGFADSVRRQPHHRPKAFQLCDHFADGADA